MIKHVILWVLDEKLSEIEKENVKKNAKKALEALVGKVEGLVSLELNINPLETSNCDMMLDATLESFDALRHYATHPDHVAAANTFVRPFAKTRLCMDFEK